MYLCKYMFLAKYIHTITCKLSSSKGFMFELFQVMTPGRLQFGKIRYLETGIDVASCLAVSQIFSST